MNKLSSSRPSLFPMLIWTSELKIHANPKISRPASFHLQKLAQAVMTESE